MREGLRKLLLATASVTSIVGGRVFITRVPQKADREKEHILITQMSSEENKSFDGTSELRFLSFDVDCKGATSSKADILAKAVRALLKDYTGAAGDQTVEAVLFNGESDGFEPPVDGSDKGLYVTVLDFQIQYSPV